MSCADIETLITSYVDREASESDRAGVAAHLEACLRCRLRVAAEYEARMLIRARASQLGCRAPESLRARCRAASHRPTFFGRARLFAGRHPVPLSAAAALILAVATLFGVGLFGRSNTALAAQLTLDHLKCFALSSDQVAPVIASTIREEFRTHDGWRVPIPEPSSAERLTLVGSRHCLSGEGRTAHVLYRRAGHPVSLFLIPHTVHAEENLEIMGHVAVIWSRSDMTYVVLARQPRTDAEEVARYVKLVTE